MESLVCIFAHPDDEAFGPAGSIAKFSQEVDTHLVCVTDGDTDPQFTTNDPTGLVDVRKQELCTSANILGVQTVDFLGFQDGTLSNNLYPRLIDSITQIIDKYQPDTLMTFDRLGVSGHIDHIVVSLVTTYVFQATEYLQSLYYFCESKEILDSLDGYFVYVPPGCDDAHADLTIDVTQYWDKKMQAIYAHRSQIADADSIIGLFAAHPKRDHFHILTK